MHLKSPFLFGLMAILLLGGTITPAISQSSPDSNSIVINEVEINNGSNGTEFVELYNPTSQPIDISGWLLVPTAIWKQYEIPSNTVIEPGSFLSFTHVNYWFKDFGDIVSLYDDAGNLIDDTPLLVDTENDYKSWQRVTDGLKTNSDSDWELKRYTPISSNGVITETFVSQFLMTASTDKSEYVLGDELIISGTVSELMYTEKPYFSSEIIKVSISGPNYYKNIALFPERDLTFSTSLNLQKVYGLSDGAFTAKVSYGENIIETNFLITDATESTSAETIDETIEIFTDKTSYIPGQTVIISAETNSSIDYAGLDYIVLDPTGEKFASGTIFPNSEFSTVHKAGGGQIYPFSTQLLLHGINPVYGTYEIQGVFKAQDPIYRSAGVEITSSATFQLVEDIKDDVIISLFTDKEIYEVGEIVKITGRSNDIWTEDLELRIIQTGIFESEARYQAFAPFDEKYSIKLNGDGTFEYDFKIPANFQPELSYGDYLIEVSEYFGESFVKIKVVENPDSYVDIRTPLGLSMDKSKYVLGTSFSLTGTIMDYIQRTSAVRSDNSVQFTITDPQGKAVMSEDRRQNNNFSYEATSPNDKLKFVAIPDAIGNFQISAVLYPIQFELGKHTITAHYPISNTSESVEFEIVSAQSEILTPTESKEPLEFELCTSTSNIETIKKDIMKFGKAEDSASMDTINCDGITDFKTGEKLVIVGTVQVKETTSLDQSSVRTSGQTQEGHSYATNYAQSEINFVELSIPYPQSLIISGAYRTIPGEGENYHGGGGEGTQCQPGETGVKWTTNADGTFKSNVNKKCEEAVGTTRNSSSDSERHTGYDGQKILMQKMRHLTDMNLKAYPDSEGNFHGIFDLRAGVFDSGIYNLKATYFGHYADESFLITDDSVKGGSPELVLDLDREEYVRGEIVSISGKIKNVYYYDSVSLKISTPDVSQINCLIGQQCGFGNTEKKIRVSEGTDGASFFMNYRIPSGEASLGKYTVMADTHFGAVEKTFFVVNESDIFTQEPTTPEPSPVGIAKKIIDKFNRIPDTEIPITLGEKSSEESTLVPRVLQGSLFTSARGEESNVNLRITTSSGQCVVGQAVDCLVTESTRKPGAIYSIASIDDVDYKIRYSGNDVRLEKFSIVPAESNSQIDINNWNVEIIKDEQPTRFYYKISYVALE